MKTQNSNIQFFVALIVLCFCSCNSSNDNGRYIDMTSFIGEEVSNDIDDIGMTMQFIPLETNDSLLLYGNSIIKYMDADHIIIESGRSLYMFDGDGRFLNRIGRRGQGPGEYISPGRVSYDPISKHLYLFTNKYLQEWSLDGQYIKTVEFPNPATLQSVSALPGDTLFVVRRTYGGSGKLTQSVQWCDRDCKLIGEKNLLVDSTKIDIAMYASPEYYRVGNVEYFRSEWDNKLSRIIYPDISEYRVFDFGRYNADRVVFQSGNLREQLGDRYANITKCIMGNGNTWMTFRLDDRDNYILIDAQGKCLFHSIASDPEDEAVGIPVVKGHGLAFWPSHIDDLARISCLIDPGSLDETDLSLLSEKAGRPITAEDNVIVAVARLD